MAITFVQRAANPADSAALFNSGNATILASALSSAVAGDILVAGGYLRGDGSSNVTMQAGDGQTWNALTNNAFGSPDFIVYRRFWARYTGSFSADPAMVPSSLGTFLSQGLTINVFRPTNAANTWSVEVAESGTLFSAPGGAFDVVITGQTPTAPSTFTLASWLARDAVPTFSTLTGGWTYPGGGAQLRNTGNSDASTSEAYLIQTSAAATGSVSNRMSSDRSGYKHIVTFRENVVAVSPPPRPSFNPVYFLM